MTRQCSKLLLANRSPSIDNHAIPLTGSLVVKQPGTHQEKLESLVQHINTLIDRQELVSSIVDKQEIRRHDLVKSLFEREKYTELRHLLDHLHPADIAYVLESLPLDRRHLTWGLVNKKQCGAVLLEVSNAVRETLFMAGLTGVLVPITLKKLGLAPILGNSILITGITDTMGFFIFLGFAAMVYATV
jgi:Mg/Co/Ni transporter MgtE